MAYAKHSLAIGPRFRVFTPNSLILNNVSSEWLAVEMSAWYVGDPLRSLARSLNFLSSLCEGGGLTSNQLYTQLETHCDRSRNA